MNQTNVIYIPQTPLRLNSHRIILALYAKTGEITAFCTVYYATFV